MRKIGFALCALALIFAACGCSAPPSKGEEKEAAVIQLSTPAPSAWLCEEVFGEAFWEANDLRVLEEIASLGMAVANDRAYQLMRSGDVYRYDPASGEYSFFTRVSAPPKSTSDERFGGEISYSELSEDMRERADGAVFQLFGSADTLYGYNPLSGRLGGIDEGGIHWSGVFLDTSVQTQSDASWPAGLLYGFAEDGFLYGLIDESGEMREGDFHGVLLRFDMRSGNCREIGLPGVYALCPYTPGHILLLEKSEGGEMSLSDYGIADGKREPLPIALPADIGAIASNDWAEVTSRVSGLAYDRNGESLFLATEGGLWRSERGGAFEPLFVEGELWEELNYGARAQTLADGSYLFHNGSKYLVSRGGS